MLLPLIMYIHRLDLSRVKSNISIIISSTELLTYVEIKLVQTCSHFKFEVTLVTWYKGCEVVYFKQTENI